MKSVIVVAGLLFLATYASAKEFTSDLDRFQGQWLTEEERDGHTVKLEASFVKEKIEFKSSTGEWYKGTFELDEDSKKIFVTVKDGPAPEFNGKVSNGIYRFDGDEMTIAASPPGSDYEPKDFDDPKCRVVTLTRK